MPHKLLPSAGCGAPLSSEPRSQQKNMCDCIVEQLLLTSFSRKSSSEKNNIIERGRPTPALTGLTKAKSNSSWTRHFQVSMYEKSEWLTGCAKFNKLFCWPCILFLNEKGVWNNKGYDDLGNLYVSMQKHERTQVHIRSMLALKTFRSTLVDLQSGERVKRSIEQHNKKVRENREVLQRLIDAVTFLGSQELALRGHSEVESSINKDNYVELIQLLGRYDERLARHLETSTVFAGMSDHIQNDLIEAVSMVMRDEITREVRQAQFVSILLDETTDMSSAAQLSTALRYVSQNGTVEERFMGFSDVSENRDAAALSRHVFDFVDELDCGGKLVAQTYDGAAVTSGDLSGLQARVRERFPCATFVHCRAHVLNLVLSQACSRNKHCKIFFSTLNGLASFFSASAKRANALDETAHRRFPGAAQTRWNCTSRLVNTAKENYSSLVQLFSEIRNEPQDWDDDTVLMAGGFLHHFEDEKFRFLLEIFADIFSHTDALFRVLQSESVDVGYCAGEVKRVTELLEQKRDVFCDVLVTTVESSENPPKRCRLSMENDFRQLYTDVFDTVVSQLRKRFGSLEKMKFLDLLNLTKFTEYRRNFPEAAFTSLKETYGRFFDDILLHSELSVLYSSPDLAKRNVAELTSFMNETNVREAMGEVYKLCCLFLTVPSTTASEERTFSALERVKTFTRNTVGQVRLSGLGLMAIERKLLHKLKAGGTFYDKVTEYYIKKTPHMDFIYK